MFADIITHLDKSKDAFALANGQDVVLLLGSNSGSAFFDFLTNTRTDQEGFCELPLLVSKVVLFSTLGFVRSGAVVLSGALWFYQKKDPLIDSANIKLLLELIKNVNTIRPLIIIDADDVSVFRDFLRVVFTQIDNLFLNIEVDAECLNFYFVNINQHQRAVIAEIILDIKKNTSEFGCKNVIAVQAMFESLWRDFSDDKTFVDTFSSTRKTVFKNFLEKMTIKFPSEKINIDFFNEKNSIVSPPEEKLKTPARKKSLDAIKESMVVSVKCPVSLIVASNHEELIETKKEIYFLLVKLFDKFCSFEEGVDECLLEIEELLKSHKVFCSLSDFQKLIPKKQSMFSELNFLIENQIQYLFNRGNARDHYFFSKMIYRIIRFNFIDEGRLFFDCMQNINHKFIAYVDAQSRKIKEKIRIFRDGVFSEEIDVLVQNLFSFSVFFQFFPELSDFVAAQKAEINSLLNNELSCVRSSFNPENVELQELECFISEHDSFVRMSREKNTRVILNELSLLGLKVVPDFVVYLDDLKKKIIDHKNAIIQLEKLNTRLEHKAQSIADQLDNFHGFQNNLSPQRSYFFWKNTVDKPTEYLQSLGFESIEELKNEKASIDADITQNLAEIHDLQLALKIKIEFFQKAELIKEKIEHFDVSDHTLSEIFFAQSEISRNFKDLNDLRNKVQMLRTTILYRWKCAEVTVPKDLYFLNRVILCLLKMKKLNYFDINTESLTLTINSVDLYLLKTVENIQKKVHFFILQLQSNLICIDEAAIKKIIAAIKYAKLLINVLPKESMRDLPDLLIYFSDKLALIFLDHFDAAANFLYADQYQAFQKLHKALKQFCVFDGFFQNLNISEQVSRYQALYRQKIDNVYSNVIFLLDNKHYLSTINSLKLLYVPEDFLIKAKFQQVIDAVEIKVKLTFEHFESLFLHDNSNFDLIMIVELKSLRDYLKFLSELIRVYPLYSLQAEEFIIYQKNLIQILNKNVGVFVAHYQSELEHRMIVRAQCKIKQSQQLLATVHPYLEACHIDVLERFTKIFELMISTAIEAYRTMPLKQMMYDANPAFLYEQLALAKAYDYIQFQQCIVKLNACIAENFRAIFASWSDVKKDSDHESSIRLCRSALLALPPSSSRENLLIQLEDLTQETSLRRADAQAVGYKRR